MTERTKLPAPQEPTLIYKYHPIVVDTIRYLGSMTTRQRFFTNRDAEEALSSGKAKVKQSGDVCLVSYEHRTAVFDFPKGVRLDE